MMMDLFDRLFPINRSITGDGVRQTLGILNEIAPIQQHEYATGTVCYDWAVPKEWNVWSAYVKDSKGKTLIDFHNHNLHLMGYSVPVSGYFNKDELMEHIHTRPDLPNAIPYVTSYYKENWGFCVEHQRLSEFTDDHYEVVIDSELKNGHLTIGEGYLSGASQKEILFSTYICHPSMAINELSGPLVQTMIYKQLLERTNLKYSYRFLFVPETIGSILFLSQHGEQLKQNVAAGYIVNCVGHRSPFTYKKSRQGATLADKAALHVLRQSTKPYTVLEWNPFGSDERQYGSQGFNLPVGSLMRTMYAEYPEYHTSLDNRSLISEEALQETVQMYLDIIDTLEANETYKCTHIHCEPKLDKRGLYPTTGGTRDEAEKKQILKVINLLAFSDGCHDVMDIADKLGIMGKDLRATAELLEAKELLVNIGNYTRRAGDSAWSIIG